MDKKEYDEELEDGLAKYYGKPPYGFLGNPDKHNAWLFQRLVDEYGMSNIKKACKKLGV